MAVLPDERAVSDTHRAFLALGSNVGDRVGHLERAVAAIPDVTGVSDVYETPPVGGVQQGPYLNLVVRLDTTADARRLLGICREREAAALRERKVRWGPRTLDVDVLWVDGETHLPESTTLCIGDIDEKLNDKGYIVPGLGDAGDLAYGAKM